MNDSDHIIDAALRDQGAIDPSPSFAARVMRAVRDEAELPPIGFPRGLALLAGISLLAVIVVGAAVEPVAPISIPEAGVATSIAALACALATLVAVGLVEARS